MSFTTILFLILIGLLAGLFSGFMGVGGGVVMIPLMVFLLGFSHHQAQGTSLAVLAVPVTFLAAYSYYKEGFVNWKFAAVIAIAFVVGGIIGSKIAVQLDESLLKKIFGFVLAAVALKMIMAK